MKIKNWRKIIIVLISAIIMLFIGGCKGDMFLEQATNEKVPEKPIFDSGHIQATIVNLEKEPAEENSASIRIDKILTYDHDSRADYEPLKVGDEVNVVFQWGVDAKTIDGPPINNQLGDIRLPGVNEGDKISAEINNQYGWRIFEYDLIK